MCWSEFHFRTGLFFSSCLINLECFVCYDAESEEHEDSCKHKDQRVSLTMSFLFSRKMDSFLRKTTTSSSSSSSSRSRIFTSMWTMFLFLIFSSVRVSSARFSSRHRATADTWQTDHWSFHLLCPVPAEAATNYYFNTFLQELMNELKIACLIFCA